MAAKLTRKVASNLGLAELIPVRLRGGDAEPLGSGYLPLQTIAQADGWILVPADREGHPEGAAVLRRLIPTVDALVTNVRPAALGRLGFSYEACHKLNPKLVYAAATGFGQDGPWAARPPR